MYSHQSKALGDLRWAIGSASLLTGTSYCTSEWSLAQLKMEQEWLVPLTKDPSPLVDFLAQHKTRRLGKYYESLLAYWFQNSVSFELIFHSIQVRDKKRTLGEFDYVIRNKATGEYWHIESAIKYYLQSNQSVNYSDWYGPHTGDRLDIKSDKLINKQLQLAEQPAAQEILAKYGIGALQKMALLRGFFFYHWRTEKPNIPQGFDLQHNIGWWAYFREFIEEAEDNFYYYPAKKMEWFSTMLPTRSEEVYTLAELKVWLMERMAILPNSYFLIQYTEQNGKWKEVSRGFVLPNSWPLFTF